MDRSTVGGMSDLLSPLVQPGVVLGSFNLSDPEFWNAPREFREGAFHTLRTQAPLTFWEEWDFVDSPFPKGNGYWALTTYNDVWHVNRNPQIFSSAGGITIPDSQPEMNEFFGSMIAMDDPRHYRLRSIVAKGFTPKETAKIEGYVKDIAKRLVDNVLERHPDGSCDFVTELAAQLPLQIICEMMGVPAEDHEQIFNWTNTILGIGDPEFGESFDDLIAAAMGMFAYAQQLGEDRLKTATDDLTSVMMHAVVDDERLTSQEFGSFFILLAVAGNETTRNAISHGMRALTLYPDQRKIWWDDFQTHTRTAVDEMVRWASPVIYMRRVATQDTEINGTKIAEGDKLAMFYNSANRDETIWPDAYTFDVRRPLQPPQAGFGAGGPHFCLGANLARREIGVMFQEIHDRLPNMRITGEPDYLKSSSFINGIKHMECSWT
jgi:cytochrome P450